MSIGSVEQRFRDVVWARQGWRGWAAWVALQPASALFASAVTVRDAAYRLGILRPQRAGIPVVSVGNLCVGGTGKTPMTLWLARQLAADGTRTAILLRGYSGAAAGVTIVSHGHGPEVGVEPVGDEAVMLAKCFDGVVVTARKRTEGVAAAVRLGSQVVVLDDGFQHRALARDFDLVLVNGRRGGFLPAGPMREHPRALARADAVAVVRKAGEAVVEPAIEKPVFHVAFRTRALVESDGGRWRELPLNLLTGRRVAAVCGIAEPSSFYTAIRQWEAEIGEIFEYPDHHHYGASEWQAISRGTRDVEFIVTTEKDLVKLERFPFAKGKLIALRIEPEIENSEALLRMVRERAGLTRGQSAGVNIHDDQ
jgi:tetraacyldisaccharide 4'-kinase